MRTCPWLVVALCALGCSSSEATSTPPPAVCTATTFPNDPTELSVTQVTATLLDADGAPAPSVPTQLCGVNLCTYSDSNASGNVSMPSRTPLVQPAFKYGDGFDYVELAVAVSEDGAHPLGELIAVRLPEYAAGAVFPKSGGTVTNGDVTLKLAAGTVTTFDDLTYLDESQWTFRTAGVPVVDGSAAFPEDLGFEVVYGLAPIGTEFCPAAGLSVPNSLEWAPGTEVEVFIQGLKTGSVDHGPDWAPYGGWAPVATAVVSADGSTIDTTDGGIPILSSVALRRK